MNFAQVSGVVTCAVAVALVGCGNDRREQTSSVVAAVTGRCTAVKIVSPAHMVTHPIESPVTLRAEVTCPQGVVGEVQFWVRPNGAHQWTKLPGYSTAPVSWEPPHSGAWNVTAVAHAVGATSASDVRAATIATRVAPHGAPRAVADVLTTQMSTAQAIDLTANDEDPDGDKLIVTGFTQGAHGKVTLSGSTATYTPRPGFVGTDCFHYTVSDGNGHSSTAKVEVVVKAVTPMCRSPRSPAVAIATGRPRTGSGPRRRSES